MQEVISELKNNNVTYWVTDGTALKLYRDNTIFPSTDFDFGIFACEIPKVLNICNNLKALGYLVVYQHRLPFVDSYIMVLPPKPCKFGPISFNFYHKANNEAFSKNFNNPFRKEKIWVKFFSLGFKLQEKPLNSNNSISRKIFSFIPKPIKDIIGKILFTIYENYAKTYWMVIPLNFFESLQKITIYDLELYIPKDIEKYLEYRYGSTWKTPIKNWNKFECQNVRIRPLKYPKVKKYTVKCDDIISEHKGPDIFSFTDKEIDEILLRDQKV